MQMIQPTPIENQPVQYFSPIRLITVISYLTLLGVAAGGVSSIPLIIERWQATAVIGVFGLILGRIPPPLSTSIRKSPYFPLLLLTLLTVILMEYHEASIYFAILFFILSVTAGLHFPLRISLLWTVFFILITIVNLIRIWGWRYALQVTIPLSTGFLFFNVISNALKRIQSAQIENQKLVEDLNAKNQQLEEYYTQVETLTAIEERNRLAREMHDTIGHYLTVSAVQLEGAQRLIDSNPAKSKEILGTAYHQIREALNALRQTVGRLREPIELELTLTQALNRLIDSFQSATSIQVSLNISANFPSINTNAHLVIYRTAQEALTNIQKHAQANRVEITLSATDSSIQFTVQDDGIGFIESQQPDRFGLLGIRERVREVNGQIQIQSKPKNGTKINLEIPRQQS